jgi:phosphatidylinositol alpha-1,6-mannosyltransferase
MRRVRCGVYLHGLDIVAPSMIYARLWLPFIRRCDLIICNSANTRDLAIAHGVPAERISVLNPGTFVPAPPPAARIEEFRLMLGLAARPLLLSVGRFTKRKGLAEFVSGSLPEIARQIPSVALVIVGDEASDALHGASGNERHRILKAAEEAGVFENVVFAGRLEEAQLESAYAAAACHVFPVIEVAGDVEGFGMVALESAARGLPTVAFCVGGIPDAVSDPESGVLVPAGDYSSFSTAVIRFLRSEVRAAERQSARDFAQSKDWLAFHIRLRELLGHVG